MQSMMWKVFVLLTAGIMIFVACGEESDDSGSTIPQRIGITIPSSLVDSGQQGRSLLKATSTNVGPGYEHLKEWVTAGKQVVEIIDTVLSFVYQNREAILANLGTQVSADNGEWFYMFEQSGGGYYLYHGTTIGSTNFYIDWTKNGDKFKGKTMFFFGQGNDAQKALVYFDQTPAQPYLDIYVLYRGTVPYTNIHVKLVQAGDAEVQAAAKGVTDNPTDWPYGWNVSGYGKEGAAGGAYAISIGSTNWSQGVTNFIGTNYRYEEYFTANGTPQWKLAIADVYTNGMLLLVQDYVITNETWTNEGSRNTTVKDILDSIPLLESSDFPTVTLP